MILTSFTVSVSRSKNALSYISHNAQLFPQAEQPIICELASMCKIGDPLRDELLWNAAYLKDYDALRHIF